MNINQDIFDKLQADIKSGALDPQLDMLQSMITERKRIKTLTKGYALRNGDIVRFNELTKPRYMIGLKAKVLDVNQVTAWLELLPDQGDAGKFGRAQRIRCPFNLIDKV